LKEAVDVCQKTRSGGPSKPQILRGELREIGVCQNARISAGANAPFLDSPSSARIMETLAN